MKPKKTEKATVTYLLRNNTVCLACKKQNIHTGSAELANSSHTWNGYGGKSEKSDLTTRHTAVRELFGESKVLANIEDLELVGKIFFFWPNNNTDIPNMEVYFYFLSVFEGEPEETDEMGTPVFFERDKIPYNEMLSADKLFLPRMLGGEEIVADIFFGKSLTNHHIRYRNEKLSE